jgi:hypothetical protein
MRTTLTTLLLALLAVTAVAAAANAAPVQQKPLTGTWTGTTSQDVEILDPGTGEVVSSEWSKRMTVTAFKGHLVSIAATIRVVCPGPGVRDLLIRKSWQITKRGIPKGPEIGRFGGFGVRVDDAGGQTVSIGGTLGAASASAHFDTSEGGCSGKGTWKGTRRL